MSKNEKSKLQKIESQEMEQNVARLQKLVENPTTTGLLEFATGIISTAIDKPSNLILSVGHIAQAISKKKLFQQLFDEVQEYRKIGVIEDKDLNSDRTGSLLEDLLKTIDSESLDPEKFNALKSIFVKSILKGTDEHKQMIAYQYFQVCKKLSSLDILILKQAYLNHKKDRPLSNGDIAGWENIIATELDLPMELVTQSRINNSPVSQSPNTSVFDPNIDGGRYGLSYLGLAIIKFIEES